MKRIKISVIVICALLMVSTMTACGSADKLKESTDVTSQSKETSMTSSGREEIGDTASAAQSAQKNSTEPDKETILIVYFSCTGHTESVANTIAGVTGGDMYKITPAREYTEDDLNYNDSNSRTSLEQNDDSSRPEISGEIADWNQYDTVYVGYPIWWGQEPRIMDTFAENYDFTGKTIIPFCTSEGSGIGSSSSNLASLAGEGNWLVGERLDSKISSDEVSDWISQLKLTEDSAKAIETSETCNQENGEDMDSSKYTPGVTGDQTAEYGKIPYQVQEIWLESRGYRIYGKVYIPDTENKCPLVIFAHELGTTHSTGEGYAEYFASRGVAYYVFDFPGGSISGGKSEGKTTDMSVMTEAEDLKNVTQAAEKWDFVDSSRIYLHGGSQGGMVAAVTATRIPDEVAGLILAYPAFIIPDQLHHDFDSLADVPDEFTYIGWINVGKIYAEDVWNYDVYKEIGIYKGPILILHGDRDSTVPMTYAERAEKAYENAELHVIKGGGHEFFGDAFDQAVRYMEQFLSDQGAIRQ